MWIHYAIDNAYNDHYYLSNLFQVEEKVMLKK